MKCSRSESPDALQAADGSAGVSDNIDDDDSTVSSEDCMSCSGEVSSTMKIAIMMSY